MKRSEISVGTDPLNTLIRTVEFGPREREARPFVCLSFSALDFTFGELFRDCVLAVCWIIGPGSTIVGSGPSIGVVHLMITNG